MFDHLDALAGGTVNVAKAVPFRLLGQATGHAEVYNIFIILLKLFFVRFISIYLTEFELYDS